MVALGKTKMNSKRGKMGDYLKASQQPLKEGENSFLFAQYQSSKFSSRGFLEKR